MLSILNLSFGLCTCMPHHTDTQSRLSVKLEGQIFKNKRTKGF